MKSAMKKSISFGLAVVMLLIIWPVMNIPVSAALATTPMVATGKFFTLALKFDGTVWAWGDNNHHQLGAGVEEEIGGSRRSYPVQVLGLTNVASIAAGREHAVALKSDGTVWCWGSAGNGQFSGSTYGPFESPTPVRISGLSNITAIAAGAYHTVALKSDGTVWLLGRGPNDNLNGTISPVKVPGLSGVTAITMGLALKSDGTVWSWGYNNYGKLTSASAPISGFSGIKAIVGGAGYAIEQSYIAALKSDGTVWALGTNNNGQIGDGTTTNRPAPTRACHLKLDKH
ncbi:MAG: hypothetical protein LBS74_03570 [Oscillospiraceae bacterium]|jgi:alpha-tubulin suppressor-like RCC1 family protein|nr:hypothetical protein [Oscillospiraceae bacterium]